MRTGGCAADVWHTKKLNVRAMIIDHQPAKVRGDQLAWGDRCGVSRGEWRDSGYGVPVIAPLSSVRGVLGAVGWPAFQVGGGGGEQQQRREHVAWGGSCDVCTGAGSTFSPPRLA
jgi:hypothetical protein